MAWQDCMRPGFFGKHRDWAMARYDEHFGEDNWRIAWKWNNTVVDFERSCMIYEDSYYVDSFEREDLWKNLALTACDVYDHTPTNVNSGLDYLIQEGGSTHIQDITIRRVLARRGWEFEGDELIQIRSHSKYWGENLSPGRVPFHLPEMIVEDRLEGWWDVDSVEDFYQSNKILQMKY